MFGLSFSELLLILIVGILVVGPQDIPKVVASVLRFVKALRRVGDEVKAEMGKILEEEKLDELAKDIDVRYIIDDAGRRQRVYDISELLEEKKTPEEQP